MDYLSSQPQFNNLSLSDLLKARDQFHAHLMHKANVIGTAVGRYLIRKDDPYHGAEEDEGRQRKRRPKPPRTLANSEVRDYSWPCILVFVSRWVEEERFSSERHLSMIDFVPKTIYLENGRSVPVCIVEAPVVNTAPQALAFEDLNFPSSGLSGAYPVYTKVQGATHFASIGCLVTDGHKLYALTNRHVVGQPGEELFSKVKGEILSIGHSSEKQIGRLPFEEVYDTWPGKHVYVNVDVGLIEIEDQTQWEPFVNGIGELGPLADLSVYNLTLSIIGCPVRAYGCASGRLSGRIAALFYRYKSVGGFEYVADFLIGSRDEKPLLTRPGDSGTIWVMETNDARQNSMPIAIQWGGAVFSAPTAQLPFALATNLSTVCRELEVDLFRSRSLASFDYWGTVGHYTIGALAYTQVVDGNLRSLMQANRDNIGFDETGKNKKYVAGFVQLADVPDNVWKADPGDSPFGRKGPENPNHYADMDYRPKKGQGTAPSLDDLTPNAAALKTSTWIAYYDSIGWTQSSQRGLLPFRIWQIYKKMVEYVAAGDVERFVTAAGILAHYVGDACQPLHSSYLDDGDPFRYPDGNPSATMLKHSRGYGHGVHSAFESNMLDDKFKEFFPGISNYLGQEPPLPTIRGGRKAAFAAIELMRRSRARIEPMNIVETYADVIHSGNGDDPSTALWDKFHEQTYLAIADGCRTLAMLWDSAWKEGQGSNIPTSKLQEIKQYRLKEIYEGEGDSKSFLPSVEIEQIDDYL
ncbi:MAG TPA: hypothetical protein VIW80_00240 [Pyrinomonadaceae bacterium]|jgi:hypothetical protein